MGLEFCVLGSRIFREKWASDFACGGIGKAAMGHGFLHFGSEFGEVTANLGRTLTKWVNLLDGAA